MFEKKISSKINRLWKIWAKKKNSGYKLTKLGVFLVLLLKTVQPKRLSTVRGHISLEFKLLKWTTGNRQTLPCFKSGWIAFIWSFSDRNWPSSKLFLFAQFQSFSFYPKCMRVICLYSTFIIWILQCTVVHRSHMKYHQNTPHTNTLYLCIQNQFENLFYSIQWH